MDCFSEYFLADLGSTYNHIWKNLTMVRKTVENQPPGRLKFFSREPPSRIQPQFVNLWIDEIIYQFLHIQDYDYLADLDKFWYHLVADENVSNLFYIQFTFCILRLKNEVTNRCCRQNTVGENSHFNLSWSNIIKFLGRKRYFWWENEIPKRLPLKTALL